MENIRPRWEWRTFGDAFGVAEQHIKAFQPDRLRESAEVYILSAASNANVKIRHTLIDIKTLQQVDEEGLELWKPDLKASFPLRREEIVKIFETLRVASQPFHRDAYTLEQFIGELVKASHHLRTVDIRKKRTGYPINGCIAEIAELTVEDLSTRTVAIEAEDPVLLMTTVRQLGLDRFSNVNYVRRLKNLVHMTA